MLLCVLLLTGCSSTFAYNNASWLVYWYLDDYVELNSQQGEQFDEILSEWQSWHRSNELPKYEAHLNELIIDIKNNDIDQARIAYHRDKGREHWVRVRTHFTPGLVAMSKTLSNEQLTYLFAKLEKDNKEDEEEMLEGRQLSPEERAKKWVKRNQKGAKKWIGKLNAEQKAHISKFQNRYEKTGEFWLKYTRSYQQALREVFAGTDRGIGFEEELTQLIQNPEVFRSSEFVEAREANNAASAEYLIGLLNLANDKQINQLIEEIDDIKQDIIVLKNNK